MSSYNVTPNFDNLILQSLMGRLQIRPSNNHHLNSIPHSFLNQSLEDLLFENLSEDDDDDVEDSKAYLAKEESKLGEEIIRTILSGQTQSLKPNSGQAVSIGEHQICVEFHEEKGSDDRVWEWHGHMILWDEENGYMPDYIYGNYFETMTEKQVVAKDEGDDDEGMQKDDEKVANLV